MSVLEVPAPLLHQIEQHAVATYPEECCGVLIGAALDQGEAVRVEQLRPADNTREAASRHHRYLIPPQTIVEAERAARALGLEIVGYYHSHPDHPAEPSEFDKDHAWPDTSYLIVSVRRGQVADVRSWRLLDNRERFREERVAAIEPAPKPHRGLDEQRRQAREAMPKESRS